MFVVQPKMGRFFVGDDEGYEAFAATLAAGNRWKVIGLVAGIAATGALLVAVVNRDGGVAWPILGLKTGLLAAAAAVFAYVSWRHWPKRVFALAGERPRLRRELRLAAMAMVGLVGAAFVLSYLG